MIEIGKKLQDKRISMKLTTKDVAKITRMPEENIIAIEKGDFDYFKNDLTYLKFYVRAYCKALDVPFEDIKENFKNSYDTYTNTLSIQAIKEQEELENSISEKAKKQSKPILADKDRKSIKHNVKSSRNFTKNKIDVSLISLLVIIGLVAVVLIFVLSSSLFTSTSSSDTSKKDDKVEETSPTPEDKNTTDDETDSKKETTKKSSVKIAQSANSITSFDVSGIKSGDKIKIEITFTNDCWVLGTLNNAAITEMASNTYGTATPITYEGVANANDVYYIRFGNFKNATIKINGEDIPTDATLKDQAVSNITIKVLGE